MRYNDLTVAEVLAEARKRGVKEFGDWIEAEIARRKAERDAELNAPVETPVGLIEVGKWYDIEAAKYGKPRRYKRVQLSRLGGYGHPRLTYASSATAQYLFPGDAGKITKITEVE